MSTDRRTMRLPATTPRHELRATEPDWHRNLRAWRNPRPSVLGAPLAALGAFIADHVAALTLIALATAFFAGVMTGLCLPGAAP
ncbi:MAG: hypothetical protein ACTHK2_09055 [Dokdonella sp.]|uniref:hypothetical protein n=1 Tax=Dokdonella sp. TaxID=2291710 RepID=UPI003F80E0AA